MRYSGRTVSIGLRKILPCSYHLSDGCFLRFEFSSAGARLAPSDDFFSELATFLQRYNLDREVGITKALPPEHLWKEELSVTGMISTIVSPEDLVTN